MKLQGAAQSICNLKYTVPKNIPTAFQYLAMDLAIIIILL